MITIFLPLLLSLSASAAPANTAQWISPDFVVSKAPDGWKPSHPFAKPFGATPDQLRAACETRMKTTLCVNDLSDNELASGWNSAPCDADSAQYVPQAMELYDEMPDRIRPLYCSLEKIFLSDNISSVAFASSIGGWSGTKGAFVGARKSTFVQTPPASDLVSWKEQLIFGGSDTFLANDPSLVQVKYSIHTDHLKGDALFYVIMHELGHVVDFQNGVNGSSKYGWSKLSWGHFGGAASGAGYFDQDKICFYGCDGHLDAADALKIYTSLTTSAFITTYSGVNSYEDFAEFWAWNIMRQYKQGSYQIEIPGQGTVDMDPVFTQNAKVKAKMDLVNQILQSPDSKIGF